MGKNNLLYAEDLSQKQDDDDHDLAPRCSTPMFDRCVGSRRRTGATGYFGEPDEEEEKGLSSRKRNDKELYREWKLRLQRGGKKARRVFKVRGVRTRGPTPDCSIVAGHFEPEIIPCPGDEAAARAAPAPVYQMWFPFSYPGFWTPTHNCQNQNQNQLWYRAQQLQHPQYINRPSPPPPPPQQFNFTPAQCFFFANLCHQGYQNAQQYFHYHGNYQANNPYPQMQPAAHLLQYQLFNTVQPFQNPPPSYPPPHFFHHGANALAFPVTMAS